MAKKIFIIDDDRDIVESLTMILEAQGYDVGASYTAADALDRARAEKPDLLILDVMFPENPSQGFELARALKADSVTSNIPILMLSAVNVRLNLGFSNRDRDESWLPVSEFVEKPVEPEKLLFLVNKLLG